MTTLDLPLRIGMLKHWLLCLLDRGRLFITGKPWWTVRSGNPTRHSRSPHWRPLRSYTCPVLCAAAGETLTQALAKQQLFGGLFGGLEPEEVIQGPASCCARPSAASATQSACLPARNIKVA